MQNGRSPEQIAHLQKQLLILPVYMHALQQLFRAEIILARDQLPQFQLRLLVQPGFRADALEIFQISDADLEVRQPGMVQRLDRHRDHLRIRLHGVIPDQLCPHLGHFL